MQLAAARAAKVNDDEGSPVVTNSGSEQFKDRPKVKLLWESLLHSAAESGGIQLERHGCPKVRS